MSRIFYILISVLFFKVALASHFRGGWITYVPVADFGTHVRIRFTANWAWRWTAVRGNIGTWINIGDQIRCRVGCGTSWSPSSIGDTNFLGTSLSGPDDWIAGEKTWEADLPKVATYRASYSSCCWISLGNGGSSMEVSVMLNTLNRPDGKINSSPVSSLAAIVRLRQGVTTQLTIPWSDADGDTVRCRQPIGSQNECGGICNWPAGTTLNGNTCTFTFNTAVLNTGWFGISLILEDFLTPTSTTPLSGVVTQFLAFVCAASGGCSLPPVIVGDRAAGSCIGVDVGVTLTERIVSRVGCSGITMRNIQITGPAGVTPGAMQQIGPLDWAITFTWTPTAIQRGVNIICATATDNTCFASNMHCFTLLVGVPSPKVNQNTIRPSGILSGATLAGAGGVITWSFDFDVQIELTTTPTFIKFYRSGGTFLFQIDVTSFPGAALSSNNQTFSFQTGNGFPSGSYYILMDGGIGVAGGTAACTIGSDGVISNSFWTFSIPSTSATATTLATATMPNAALTGSAVSITASAILPIGQTQTTTLAPGVTTVSTVSTSTTTTLVSTTTTTLTAGTTTSTTTTTTSTTLITTSSTTTTSFNLVTTAPLTTKCNRTAFIGIIVSIWTGAIGFHCFFFFAFLFTITNR